MDSNIKSKIFEMMDQKIPLKILKNVIDICNIDLNDKKLIDSNLGNNCLLLLCKNNDIDIIKYLIEEKKMDYTYKNKNDETCLSMACSYNENLDVIKYLVEKTNSQNYTNNNMENCFLLSCKTNPNLKIIKYLLEEKKNGYAL